MIAPVPHVRLASVHHLGARRTLVPCPLPWPRVLRRNLRLPRGAELETVKAWLLANGWHFEVDQRFGATWWDPATGVDHGLRGAIHAQAYREAQRLLEPRGYTLAGGSYRNGVWTWVHTVRLSTAPISKRCPLLAALKREGLA